jgi:TonB family protein
VLRRSAAAAAALFALSCCAQPGNVPGQNATGPVAAPTLSPVSRGRYQTALIDPQLIGAPTPTYPKAMLEQAQEGKVLIKCIVEVTGAMDDCSVLKLDGDPAFAAAATADLSKLRYRPATLDGHPIAASRQFAMNYAFAPQVLIPAQFIMPDAAPPRALDGAARSDVRLSCAVDFEGHAQGCSVNDWSGAMDMSSPAVAFMHRVQLYPASADGTPRAEQSATFDLTFYGEVPTPTFKRAEPPTSGTAVVFLHCTLETNGTTQDCAIDAGASDPHFFALASQEMHDTPLRADPAIVEGVPATQQRFAFLMDFWPPASTDPLDQIFIAPSNPAP